MTRIEPKSRIARKQHRLRGSALVEFALVGSFIFVPMLAGLATVGLSMVTALQVAGLNSNAGQMFSTGVDFSQASNVDVLLKVATGLNITASGGDGVIILSEITGTGNGAVCMQQFTIGNTGLYTSSYAPPMECDGMTAVNFPLLTLAQGQTAYLAETYFNSPAIWAFAPPGTSSGIYSKAIF